MVRWYQVWWYKWDRVWWYKVWTTFGGTKFGVACIQGRARPSLAKLYNWRYQALGDLPSVTQQERFRKANAGLAYDYQFIGGTCNPVVISLFQCHRVSLSLPVSIRAS